MTILIVGGTTEGREAVAVVDEAGSPFIYSTLTGQQRVEMLHGETISGALSPADVAAIKPSLVIDASHPFAVEAHRMVVEGARLAGVPAVRLERQPLPRHIGVTYCQSYTEAIDKMKADGITRLLALSGVHTISQLYPWWRHHSDTWFRVLDRDSSRNEAIGYNFPPDHLRYYHGDENDTPMLLDQLCPDAIITKNSGKSGGFTEKVETAIQRGIKVYAIDCPPLPDGYATTIYGPVGLRLAIQKLLPGFYPLRTGLTTGTTATAAAVAAARLVATGKSSETVVVTLPSGELIDVTIASCRVITPGHARAVAVKDGGDDPDVTTGLEIVVDVTSATSGHGVTIGAGEGIGRVTLPGLGIPLGEPAINPTPRRMIRENVATMLPDAHVIISIPRGREITSRTFNPRLGVIDGISVIGTSGVVRPFSNQAFIESLRRQVDVAKAAGCTAVVLNSGAKSECRLKSLFSSLPDVAFIHYGNLVGEAVKVAVEAGIKSITIGIMIGKLVKLAAGHLDTHSSGVVMSHDFLVETGRLVGLSSASLNAIPTVTLARQLWDILAIDIASPKFYDRLVTLASSHLQKLIANTDTSLRLILLPPD